MEVKKLKELEEERRIKLADLRAFRVLEEALEYIKMYNREIIQGIEVALVNLDSFEKIDENYVADEINRLYNRLVSISEEINQIKDKINAEKR